MSQIQLDSHNCGAGPSEDRIAFTSMGTKLSATYQITHICPSLEWQRFS